jgi:hypothetical protein
VLSAVAMSGSMEVSTICGRQGRAGSRASVIPFPSGSSASTRTAEGLRRPAAAKAAETLSASPVTVRPLPASRGAASAAELRVVVDDQN